MKGLGMSAKTTTIVFLVGIIFASLALSGYTFLVSNHSSSLPSVKEGLEDKKKDSDDKKDKKAAPASASASAGPEPAPAGPEEQAYSPAN
jgi:hypothetical protein